MTNKYIKLILHGNFKNNIKYQVNRVYYCVK